MATQLQVERGGTFEDISYSSFSIEIPTSEMAVAPTASVTTTVREDISANQNIRIVIDGTTRFDGQTESGGTKRSRGQVQLSAVHPADALFAEQVTFTEDPPVGTPDADQVLGAALDASNNGSNFTLDWSGSDVQLNSAYEAENRRLSDVFRDMCDRTGRVWWVEPGGTTIHVEPTGGRGTWQSLDAQADGVGVQSFDEGSVKTVRNDVTVNATAGENVTGSASDSTSISEYGRRSEKVNISYADTQAEADAYADELLITDPLAQGEIMVPQRVGDVTEPLANYTIDLTDEGKGIDATELVIEKQTIEQGRATLKVGEGSGVSMANVNRNVKSRGDENPPGTIMPAERIGDDSIAESKLEDLSVSIDKIQDEAVAEAKVRADAISETKVEDDAISTPKLQAGSIVSGKIDSAAIEAIHIDADAVEAGKIDADAVGARELIANSITADEIDVLQLNADELVVGVDADDGISFEVISDGATTRTAMIPTSDISYVGTDDDRFRGNFSSCNAGAFVVDGLTPTVTPENDDDGQVGNESAAWSEVRAYSFIDASDGSTINDGGDILANLSRGDLPPEHCRPCNDDGSEAGTDISKLARELWDICTAQQDRITSLEDRVTNLEQGND